MDLLPLANKLESNALGLLGKTIFVHFMPMECQQGILLRSPLSGTLIDHELPGYYRTQFIAIIRTPATKLEAGMTLASEAIATLTMYEKTVETMKVKYIRPASKPVVFQISEGNLIEIQAKFDIVFTE